MSVGYAFILTLIGIFFFGLVYAIWDQIVLYDIWNLDLQNQLSGNMLNIYSMMFKLIPVVVIIAVIIGMAVNSYIQKTYGGI